MRTALMTVAVTVFLVAGILAHASASGDETQTAEGEHCRMDSECRGYYRCVAGYCRVPPAMLGHADDKTPRVELRSGTASRGRFFVELAKDPSARARGLGQRPSLHPEWGMFFIFSRSVQHPFTMKPMLFPLDVVFIDVSGHVVDIVEDAQPGTSYLFSARPYSYVLEISAGKVRENGISIGDAIELSGVSTGISPSGKGYD